MKVEGYKMLRQFYAITCYDFIGPTGSPQLSSYLQSTLPADHLVQDTGKFSRIMQIFPDVKKQFYSFLWPTRFKFTYISVNRSHDTFPL